MARHRPRLIVGGEFFLPISLSLSPSLCVSDSNIETRASREFVEIVFLISIQR
jgi:hypothetical protein